MSATHFTETDRYQVTNRRHSGCDSCDGMGCAPIRANVADPLWREAHARAKPRLTPWWNKVWREAQSLWRGKGWLGFVKRLDRQDTRFADCPYCQPLEG